MSRNVVHIAYYAVLSVGERCNRIMVDSQVVSQLTIERTLIWIFSRSNARKMTTDYFVTCEIVAMHQFHETAYGWRRTYLQKHSTWTKLPGIHIEIRDCCINNFYPSPTLHVT